MSNGKSLIAYYSRAGSNYVGGNIVNLPVGNTELLRCRRAARAACRT